MRNDGQRFSPLTLIDESNVKNLKLAYAVPLGGTIGNEWNSSTRHCRFRELLYANRAFKTSADPEVYFDVLLWKLIG